VPNSSSEDPKQSRKRRRPNPVVLVLLYSFSAIAQDGSALAHAEKARALTLSAQYSEALLEWRAAIRLAPANAVFHNLYGLALQQSGQPAAAQAEFRRALHLKNAFADAQNNLAYSLWQNHQEQLAATETDRALKLSPTDPSLHLLRAQLFAHIADHSAACREFELAEPWPKDPASLWEIMENCLAANSRKTGLEAAGLLPLDADTQLSIGQWLLTANLPTESIPFLRNAPSEEGFLALAEAYLASCEPAKTIEVLSQIHPSRDSDYEARDLRASALLALGREAEAEVEFRRLVETFPSVAAAYVAATQVPLRQKHWDDALTLLNAGLSRMPGNWLLLFRRGIVYKLSGHLAEARADLIDSLRNHGEVALVAAALGDLEAENGDLSSAADLFHRSFEQTNLPQFQLAYALALDRLGDSQKALAELREASRTAPQDAQIHYTMGKMLAREGHLKEAQSEFERARRIAPGLAVNLYALGHAYLSQGQSAKAKEVMVAFQQAKRQTPPAPCQSL
jgi:Flp pilus assembly protein TadD